jgi:meso-butanediol dehydrogenase / (S,S)-butanediol dehydrogenase / diacetyl reductase
MKLANQIAIVTGGGRGIGKAIALALAREGANVVVTGRKRDVLDSTANEILALGVDAVATVTDVSDESQVADLVDGTLGKFGHIDILVNNAGITGPTSPITQVSRAEWDEVLATNLTGAFICAKAVIPQMVERGSGKIINISSIAGKTAYALRSPYAASKWGMIGLSRTLAQELGPYNIQVNTICPGPTDGVRMRGVIASRAKEMGKTEQEVERLFVEGTALKRMVNPDHVAAAVLFFVSEEGNSITGEALDVTAGFAL